MPPSRSLPPLEFCGTRPIQAARYSGLKRQLEAQAPQQSLRSRAPAPPPAPPSGADRPRLRVRLRGHADQFQDLFVDHLQLRNQHREAVACQVRYPNIVAIAEMVMSCARPLRPTGATSPYSAMWPRIVFES